MRILSGPQMNGANVRQLPGVQRETSLTLDHNITPFGCCNFFDSCADEIMSLYYNGTLGLLDWMGFNPTDVCERVVEFIPCVRPATDYRGIDTPGYIGAPCDPPNGVDWSSCHLSVEDFGRYGRHGPTRDMMKASIKYCKTRPRYRLDGSPVTSESEWDMLFTMDQILNDIRVAMITGNSAVAGQFDGLQRWVRTGYDCEALDSYVLNWNGNPMTGGPGMTLNGNAVPAGYDIVDWLLDLWRNIKERISWSPLLNNQNWQVGDTILVLPGFMARCLLDFYTCWSVCPGAQYEEVTKDSRDMREFRLTLNGGLFGMGQISLDGNTIPLLIYDWGLINGPTRGDMYFLTGSIGSQRIWEGEHLSAAQAVATLAAALGGRSDDYFATDGGRVLGKLDTDNLCTRIKLWLHPRLWCLAPWAQVRIQNVACHTPTGPLSPNPADTSFYPQTSCEPAECAHTDDQ